MEDQIPIQIQLIIPFREIYVIWCTDNENDLTAVNDTHNDKKKKASDEIWGRCTFLRAAHLQRGKTV